MADLRKLGFVATIGEDDSINLAAESSASEDEVFTELYDIRTIWKMNIFM